MSVPHVRSEGKSNVLFVLKLMRIRLVRAAINNSSHDAPDSFTAYYYEKRGNDESDRSTAAQ